MSHEQSSFGEHRHEIYEETHEQEPAMPEVDQIRAETFVDRAYPTILSCGDDREATPESIQYLREKEGLPATSSFLRYFGGKFGVARVTAVSVAAQYGKPRLNRLMPDDFFGFADGIDEAFKDLGVHPVAHSSEDAETNKAHVNPDSPNVVACAHCASQGVISVMCAQDQLSIRTAEYESKQLFGDTSSNRNFGQIVTGAEIYTELLGDQPRDFSIGRRDYLRTKTPVLILKGRHAGLGQDSTGVKHVINLARDKVSDPSLANQAGAPYYANDITQVAELILKAVPELRLDPAIVLDVMMLDHSATRAALAKHSNAPADPSLIPSLRFGNSELTLDYLSSL